MTWPLSGSEAGVDFVLSVPAERILKWEVEVGWAGGSNVTSYFPIFNKICCLLLLLKRVSVSSLGD